MGVATSAKATQDGSLWTKPFSEDLQFTSQIRGKHKARTQEFMCILWTIEQTLELPQNYYTIAASSEYINVSLHK